MASLQENSYRVSNRGQLSFPATARRRWGILEGGDVEVFDLGEAVVILPGASGSARSALATALTAEKYNEFCNSLEDPDLKDQ
jgi:bifunctional DNA-binding transcriptional regulator/antitoxin component of YhaV-PrlF toxin-antitoxin module